MLETRFAPESLLSDKRKSPEGLSTTRLGAFGFDGELKA